MKRYYISFRKCKLSFIAKLEFFLNKHTVQGKKLVENEKKAPAVFIASAFYVSSESGFTIQLLESQPLLPVLLLPEQLQPSSHGYGVLSS